ncbi:MAG: DUF721 domain-containing protein [Armatimonadota bacterium]|nr:DUF721 domain-containing protein [Armatimonadota bacterium]
MSEPDLRLGKFSHAGSVLAETLSKLGLRRRLKERELLLQWPAVVGSHIAASTRAERIADGVLLVKCKSSAWANELSLHKGEIIGRLNQVAGEALIKDIRFSVRGYHLDNEQPEEGEGATADEPAEIDKCDLECARRIASVCRDPELARAVERAVLTAKRYRKGVSGPSREEEVKRNG